jgi:hypothetical protein
LKLATGLSFGSLPDGSVLVEFFADDEPIGAQLVTADVLSPALANLMQVAMVKGAAAAKKLMDELKQAEDGKP